MSCIILLLDLAPMILRRCLVMSSMFAWEERHKEWKVLQVSNLQFSQYFHIPLWFFLEYMLTQLGYVLPTGTCLIDISERSHRLINKDWIIFVSNLNPTWRIHFKRFTTVNNLFRALQCIICTSLTFRNWHWNYKQFYPNLLPWKKITK